MVTVFRSRTAELHKGWGSSLYCKFKEGRVMGKAPGNAQHHYSSPPSPPFVLFFFNFFNFFHPLFLTGHSILNYQQTWWTSYSYHCVCKGRQLGWGGGFGNIHSTDTESGAHRHWDHTNPNSWQSHRLNLRRSPAQMLLLVPESMDVTLTDLPMLLPHVREIHIPLCKQTVTLPTRPPRTGHLLRFCGFLCRRWRLLFQFLFPIHGLGILSAVVCWILSCRLNAQRQVYTQVWRPFNTFQCSMHRLHYKKRRNAYHKSHRFNRMTIIQKIFTKLKLYIF